MLRHTPKLLNFMGFECSHGGSLGWLKSSKDCLRNGLMYTQLQGRSSNLFGSLKGPHLLRNLRATPRRSGQGSGTGWLLQCVWARLLGLTPSRRLYGPPDICVLGIGLRRVVGP